MKTKGEFFDSVYEKYEAARVEEENVKKSEQIKAVTKRRKLYKYLGTAAACLVLGVGLISTTGVFRMGAMSADSAALAAPMDAGEYNYAATESAMETGRGMNGVMMYGNDMAESEMVYEEGVMDEGMAIKSKAADMPAAMMTADEEAIFTGAAEGGAANTERADKEQKDLKLIYRADLFVQTTDFEKTVAEIKALVEQYDGYIESQEVYNGGFYSDGSYENGYYRVRIPQENYKKFVGNVGESFFVSSLQENVEDVGQAYYDTETHIKTLKIKEERLQDLLKKAEQMSDIIELENALSNTEHELEMYQSTLDNYDSLIGYSTVTLNVEKVTQFVNGVNQELTFFEKLGRNLKNGAINFGEGIERFVMWLGYNIIGIVCLFAILFVIIRFDLFGKLGKLLSRVFNRKNG